MTYSVLGIDTNQVKEIDPRTGREKVFYLPKINQQTGKEERIRLAQTARRQGTYLIGTTGAGKSALILNLVMQDIKQGKGVAVLDPHSELIFSILARLDEDDLERVILLDPLDKTHFFGLNLYSCADPANDVLVQGAYEQVEHIFDVLWLDEGEDQFGPQVREGLLYSSYALIYNSGTEYTGCGMLEIPLLFQEGTPRANMVKHIQDPVIRSYWEKKYEPFDRYEKARRADMVINKLNEFIANPIFRRIVGQGKTTIDFHDIMDHGKILLVKLPGRFERMAQILGAMVIAQLLGASYERESQHKRPQFNIYADEYQRFATRDFAKLLTEASRKYNTPVTIAHQARDFIDLKNKAATLQVANLIVLRIIRKDADEIAGNFDCTPVRTKKVLKRRTKPVFREWAETVWIENGEALYQEAEAQYVAQYEAQHNELTQRLALAEKQEQEALTRQNGASEAQAILSGASRANIPYDGSDYQHMPFHPAWYQYYDTIWRKTASWAGHPPTEIWAKVKSEEGSGWTDEKVEKTIAGLVEVKSRTVSDSFEYFYGPYTGAGVSQYTFDRKMQKKRVDYTYIEREERYALSETTRTGLQADLQVRMATASSEARRILSDLYDELSEVVKPLLHQGVWFKPELKPAIPQTIFSTGYLGLYFGPPSYRDGKPFEESLLEWPLLAKYPQPKIGEKRTVKGWARHGEWYVQEFPRVLDWLRKSQKALQALYEQRKNELHRCQEHVSSIKQQLNELKAKDQQIRPGIKAHYQKIEHHKEYLGEQPEVDKQTRISHSSSHGSSSSTGISRMGESMSHGTSSSQSTSYSTADVQWYDLVDELDQTPDQRRDEIANEIALFPDYVARVKIKDENDEFVEYTVRTLAPERGLPEKALNERIARIKATMIRNNIIRPKEVIEDEIRKRQQTLRLPQLEQPHKQGLLPPPEDEPPITRRK